MAECEVVGRTGGGAQHDEVDGGRCRDEQLLARRAAAAPRRSSPSDPTGATSLPFPGTAYTSDRPRRTLTAPTSTRSRDSVAWVTSVPSRDEQVGELALAVHLVVAQQLDDAALALGAAHALASRAAVRMSGSAWMKPPSSASVMTSGGASRRAWVPPG